MKLRAYAKINLTLDVTGRREDGYHTLDTVMQTVSVWDEVEIKKINKPGIRLFCNREYLPVDTKNTAFRAAQYFFERCGITGQGLSIHIRKYIPSRAGMGGGSADAAAVLHGLN
ncbi:MAG: 4-(cytidine 5'-diphospho)-2-C-methyl-D-erythritol kinase, partial [Acutalibacter sp.]